MVTYQFEVDDETWSAWKDTVPRSKSLDTRLVELIRADTDGRVRELPEEPDALEEPDTTPTRATTPPRMPAEVDTDALRDALPGSGDDLDGRVTAVLLMYDRLRERGHAEKAELLEVVDVDATGYASEDSLWANSVKASGERPNALTLLPGVTLEGDTYRYREP